MQQVVKIKEGHHVSPTTTLHISPYFLNHHKLAISIQTNPKAQIKFHRRYAGLAANGTTHGFVHSKNISARCAINVAIRKNFCRPPNIKSPDHQTHCKSAHQTYKKMNQQRKSHSVSATFKVNFKFHRKYISVGLNEIPVHFQFGTASDITLISQNTWTKIGKPDLLKIKHVAQSASGNDIQLTGELNCSVSFRYKQFAGTC